MTSCDVIKLANYYGHDNAKEAVNKTIVIEKQLLENLFILYKRNNYTLDYFN
jgi:hypothetical protein